MQRKTIQNNIKNKLNEWLETIKDESLKKDVKNNTLLSGGSITSMFLNEEVNDYDVYIQNQDTLLALSKYYTKAYDVTILDGRKQKEYFDDPGYGDEGDDNIFSISVNNLQPDQIKLFFDGSLEGGLKVNEGIEKEKLNYTPLYFSPNAISLSNQLQIVLRFNGDAETIHKTFDFIHATNYFTFKEGLVTNIAALESILTKQLKYQGSKYPVTTIIRIKKFLKRGWNINAGEMLKVMFQISELDLKDPNVLEEQLIGVDVAYFNMLIKVLRESKKEITSKALNTIIDKVFNEAEEEQLEIKRLYDESA